MGADTDNAAFVEVLGGILAHIGDIRCEFLHASLGFAQRLLDRLIQKLLVLTDGKTSNGVTDFLGSEIVPKGARFTSGALRTIDYDTLSLSNWTEVPSARKGMSS